MNYIKFLIVAFISTVSANNNCTITEFAQVAAVVKECSNIVINDLVVPAYSTLLLNLQNGSRVTFTGNVLFEVGYWEGPLLEISGDGVQVQGNAGHIINAQGEKYWDGQGGSGGVTKPRFVVISTTGGSVLRNIYLLNCVYFCVGIHASDLTLSGWTIDAVAGNTRGGLNTDGFGIGNGQNILIENSVIMNQDDCVVVNSGSDMVFRNLECYGSHGLSFSIGDSHNDDAAANTIRNITFSDCLVANGLYGIHVKTKKGTGVLTDVTYENIRLSGSILNAQGEKYWDGHGGSGGVTKPRFVQISTTGGSVFKNIHLKNCALFCVGIRASDLTISGWNIDSHEGRKKGKNTDGFGIAAGNNIHIENSSVDNQDDCIVVNGGTNMVFNGIKCTGSHGLSFSAGSNTNDHAKYATINNITFSNCELKDGAIGIHVKTKRGTGLITNVTYDHITMTGMQKDGIYINQDYGDVGNTTRDFQITNLKVSNVEGSIHGKGARAVHIVCNDKKCANWQWSNIDISGGAKDYCNFHPTGFDC
ncbi:polygalacturonase isoform X1 [Diabrotica virgifera virgifera]|uniref:endo-polygalacturonase n=2 Tax=Diabrotica virgifera virgifera TaxID=50390 RepID=A0ABM5JZ01_DIAVI|nr:polygalacturonase isoform X1 [Diabrotica virgifera virgifera]